MTIPISISDKFKKIISFSKKAENQFIGLLIIGLLICYRNTFNAPLIYDDYSSIIENMSIRHLNNWHDLITLPQNPGIAWRPLANISFAISYAISGLNPWAYHVMNLLIHAIAGLTLFGILNNTFDSNLFNNTIKNNANYLSVIIALIWSFHPIQTQTVTYISQRTESLMGLFYLLSLYCFIRAKKNEYQKWLILSVTFCYLGSLCKETIATAPFIIYLYDKTFISKNFIEPLKTRAIYYILLSSHWILLALLMSSLKVHGAVGYGIGISSYTYALTECKGLLTYILLSFWPHPLIFDRGPLFITSIREAFPYGVCIFILIAASLYMLIKKPILGFVMVSFFILLAPTSSIIPIVQVPIAENRVYLPLATIIIITATSCFILFGNKLSKYILSILCIICILLTLNRNHVYESGISIWTDSIIKSPLNARAHNNLGYILKDDQNKIQEAKFHFEEALRLKPDYAEAHTNLGMILALQSGHLNEAIKHYETALSIDFNNAEAHNNLANILVKISDKKNEAKLHYEYALKIKPTNAEFLNNYAVLLSDTPGKEEEAAKNFELSLQFKPNYAEAHNNYAVLLKRSPNKQILAIEHLRKAESLMPNSVAIQYNLASLLENKPEYILDCIKHYEIALQLDDDNSKIKSTRFEHLGDLVAKVADLKDTAIRYYNTSLYLNPQSHTVRTKLSWIMNKINSPNLNTIEDCIKASQSDPLNPEAHFFLGLFLSYSPGKNNEAINQYRITINLCPDYLEAHNNLGNLLSNETAHIDEAIEEYKEAIKLNTKIYSIHYNLARLLEKNPLKKKEALSEYAETLRLNPTFKEAYQALVRLKKT
jgi:protein O-mannosyl-transferase